MRGDRLGGLFGLQPAEIGEGDGSEVVRPEADVGRALPVTNEGGADDGLLTAL